MTLLTMLQQTADELFQQRPSTIIDNTDKVARRLLAAAQRQGVSLNRAYAAGSMIREASFVTVATTSQGTLTTLATEIDMTRILPNTMIERTANKVINGPLTASDWQAALSVPSSMQDNFRIRGGLLLMTPTPTAGRTIYFEYVSRYWCLAAVGGAGQTAFLDDDDTLVLDENLMILGIKWRFLKSNGQDYAEEFRDYQTELNKAISGDGGGRQSIDISGDGGWNGHPMANTPDTGFGS